MIATADTTQTCWQLTAAQRLHLDIFGYVVIEKLLSDIETAALRERLYDIEVRFRRDGSMPDGVTSLFTTSHEYFRIDNLPHVDACFHRYLTHPAIIAMAQEMVGGDVRIEQSDAAIRRPGPSSDPYSYGFHRGAYTGFGYQEHSLYHFPFVKALTNLTDLGPDDGGTEVIAGSHKLHSRLDAALIAAAQVDPSLIHRVVAPAGSTLLFFESLLHTPGIIRSGKDRVLIVGGYTPTPFQAWAGCDPCPEFLATLSDEDRARYTGNRRWTWSEKFRSLE